MSKVATASRFAHFFGGLVGKPAAAAPAAAAPAPAASPAKAEGDDDDDERKKKDGESDEDYAKRMSALDEKEKAEADKKDEEARAAAKAANFAEGFTAGGKRWENVLADARVTGHMAAACELLSTTAMSADNILAAVSVMPLETKAAHGLAARMAEAAIVAPAASAAEAAKPGSTEATVQLIQAAAAKARGETPNKAA
jgi:hypothetical protein